ncbi:MAG: DUF86 domain-containing protein [Limnochordales bacterium]|nr:DUF86 domain-containing protein [Limnochordales bacterium]
MSADRDDLVFVRHILEAISKIQRYTEGMSWETFSIDEKTQDAVVRQFEVIGEAAKKVSEAFRNQHPNVPWSQMARMRDVLIHHYFGVDLSVVWETVQRDIPTLLSVFRCWWRGPRRVPGAIPRAALRTVMQLGGNTTR